MAEALYNRFMSAHDIATLLGSGTWSELELSLEERANALDRTPWSRDFEWSSVMALSEYMLCIEVFREGIIFREHDTQGYMCLVLTGQISIQKIDEHMEQKEVAVLGRGQTVGEMSVIDDRPRSATAVATERSKLLLLTQEELNRMLAERPNLAARFIWEIARLMSRRLRQTSSRLIDLL